MYKLPNFLSTNSSVSWRWMLALLAIGCGVTGFVSGVGVTERDLSDAMFGTHLYNTLGLFILGGMDLGTPQGGPLWGRALLWFSYFAAPLVTGSTIVDWVHRILHQQHVFLRRLRDHIVLIGTEEVAHSILKKIRSLDREVQVLVVEKTMPADVLSELGERFRTRTATGDFTNEYFLRSLGVERARQVIVASDRDFDNFEAASNLLAIRPDLGKRLLVHSNRLRFLRMLNYSNVVDTALTFNSYHLAAKHMVKVVMRERFESTSGPDTVVIAGFGRFGQTILEELLKLESGTLSDVAIIDHDADRRILVAQEQNEMSASIRNHIFEGDISHPEVWKRLEQAIDLHKRNVLVLLATGADDENLRTGLWLKDKHPGAMILVRTARPSHFARAVCATKGIYTFALSEMMYESMPDAWFNGQEGPESLAPPG